MSPRSKREYREAVHLRYKNATRREKTAILDELTLIQMKGQEKALMVYIRMILKLTVNEMSNCMSDSGGLVFVVRD